MTKDEFYKRVYEQQTLNRGLLTHDELLKHFDHVRKKYYSALLPHLPANKDTPIIDIGCGYGNFLYFLEKHGFTQYEGIDFDHKQVELAQKIGLNAKVSSWNEIASNQKFGLVSALDFLEHLPREEMIPFLDSCRGALSIDGRLILRVPNAAGFFSATDYFNDLTHEWSFTPASIDALLSICGFKVVTCLNDRPRLNGLPGKLQSILLNFFRLFTKLWLGGLGLPMPRYYTKSFWIIAKLQN